MMEELTYTEAYFLLNKCVKEMKAVLPILEIIENDGDLVEQLLAGTGIATFNRFKTRIAQAEVLIAKCEVERPTNYVIGVDPASDDPSGTGSMVFVYDGDNYRFLKSILPEKDE